MTVRTRGLALALAAAALTAGPAGAAPLSVAEDGGTATRRLTVEVVGSGSVSSASRGITCGVDCAEVYAQGERVTLTATPLPGRKFLGWGGSCSGQDACTVALDEDRSVSATFTGPSRRRTLTVTVVGPGLVTSSSGGITCGVDCAGVYAPGERVTLLASPVPDQKFLGWGGACSGTEGCTVTMAADRVVTATFSGTAQARSLVLSTTGGGVVTSADGGITCGTDCAGVYADGTRVVLSATPVPGEKFVAWGGACTGSTDPCTLMLDGDRSVTAEFTGTAQGRVLTVTVVGSGSVSSADGGITCGTDCNGVYADGARVVLTATPAQSSTFVGWGGACSGTEGCSVTMDRDQSVTATFQP